MEMTEPNRKETVYYCPVCKNPVPKERNDLVCSEECFKFFNNSWARDERKEKSCWISLEVFCYTGNCLECRVYQTELEIKKRGLNKDELIGNY